MSENQPTDPYVLGQQYADALSREQTRLKAGSPLPPPLPQGEYEAHTRVFELLNPAPSELDAQFRKACKSFSVLSQANVSRNLIAAFLHSPN